MKRFFLFTVCFLLLLFFCSCPSYAVSFPDSVENIIREVKDVAVTVKTISVTLYSAVAFISRVIGFSAVLLFFATLVTSAVLSLPVFLPEGSLSFQLWPSGIFSGSCGSPPQGTSMLRSSLRSQR